VSQNFENVLVYAPSIHTGGGFVLLQALLDEWPRACEFKAVLDARARTRLSLPPRHDIEWIKPTLVSRVRGELLAWRTGQTPQFSLLCFHGLPPILPMRATVIVYVQNRLVVDSTSLVGYPSLSRLRICIERLWLRLFQGGVNQYFVQTESMRLALGSALRAGTNIRLLPFAPNVLLDAGHLRSMDRAFDFFFPASGDPHKNHGKLLDAWILLAKQGLRPRLALTVDPTSFPILIKAINVAVSRHDLNIVNLGALPFCQMGEIYQCSRALIFPSTSESFGLPLVEASRMGLPVVASELDFVRDVVCPIETFDPYSALSIKRAVCRFLK
jgi:glycosyltransferase involved in cell wall biosynthesis